VDYLVNFHPVQLGFSDQFSTGVNTIGNDAEKATVPFIDKSKIFKVRHPSYGGQNEFLSQIRSLYDVEQRIKFPECLFDCD